MAHLLANPWPPNYPTAFFNQQWVQNDLGVPLNLTLDSNTVTNAFFSTGDFVRQDVSAMEYILNKGIKVALLYGDRDYVCNCTFFPLSPHLSIIPINRPHRPLLTPSSSGKHVQGLVSKHSLSLSTIHPRTDFARPATLPSPRTPATPAAWSVKPAGISPSRAFSSPATRHRRTSPRPCTASSCGLCSTKTSQPAR